MQVRSFRQQALAFAVAAAFPPCVLAQTLPTGGEVRPEQASIFQTSPTSLHVQQHTDKAILNWQSFSIGAGAQVNFQQPSSSSIALNRVLGNNPSQIFGHLGANGRVFLVNPSGILFGPGSSVNVGALVASTLSITDEDFLAGRYTFSNAGGAGSILNQGNLFSHSGYTALLAPQVTNEGFIFANLGSVALAAGDRVTLDMVGDNLIRVNVDQATLDAAVVNRGSIEAFGGNVLLTAHSANAVLDTVLNTEGIVRATGFGLVDGEVVLSGGARGTMALSGQVSSSRGMAISGDNVVIAAGGGRNAFLTASQGQTIEARSLAITTADGNTVSLTSFGGGQTVDVIGGSLDVQAGGGSIDMSSFGGDQTIKVRDGDHIAIKATGGDVFMSAFSGKQALEIEGDGRNALEIGSAGGLGSISIFSPVQQLSAGRDGESGSITLIGPDTDFKSVLVNAGGIEGGRSTQAISTSGTLKVVGGSRPGGTPLINGLLQAGDGVQTVSAGRVEVHSGPGGAGNVAWISAVTGDQHVTVAGDIEVLAGPGGEAALQVSSSPQLPPRPGVQTISARNVLVQGGQAGTNANAFLGGNAAGGQSISLTGDLTVVGAPGGRASVFSAGPQTIEAANIRVLAGPGNGASIGSGPEYQQTIIARGDIEIAGGLSSNASISAPGAGALQSISARNITLSNGIDSQGNSAGVILGAHQVIDASGNVTLTAHSGTGTSSGVRIGASGAGATDLLLRVDGNLLLTGGTTGTNGAGLGGAGSGPTSDNNVTVIAEGDVILDGAVGGGGVRIGSGGLTPVKDGNISVTARNIRFTGTAPAAIRTLGNVELHADQFGGTISQGANGFILADGLTTTSYGSTTLAGANHVSSYSGSSQFGDVFLNNSGPIDVTNLSAVNATLVNAGPLTISGWWNTSGNTSIETLGAGANLTVTNNVFANGAMEIDVSGDLTVRGSGFTMANVASFGDQVINVTGGSLDIEGFDGAIAQIASHGGDQTVTVRDGDHVRLRSEGGSVVGMFAAGTQSVSITGIGRNAMEFGTAGGTGFVIMSAPTLALTAGVASESGSITITGPDAPDTSVQVGAGFPTPMPGEQTISTTGALTVVAGSRPGDIFVMTGIVHNGFGPQTISAGSLELRGGGAGSGNLAAINSIGGGEQRIDVAGDLVLLGGPGGFASLFSSASQAINAANVRLQGAFAGANGSAFVSAFGQNIDVSGDITVAGGSGTNNGAGIHSTAALQSISASNLRVQGAFGGANSGAFVNAAGQDIDVSGDITVAGGSGTNNGAGIHSLAALQSISALNLRLQGALAGENSGAFVNGMGQHIDVSGEIVIAGGNGTNNGGGINSTGVQTILGRPDITVTSGVSNFATINAGPGALQTIDAHDIRVSNSTGSGNSAGVIQGTHQQIDATGDVTLTAHAATGDLAGARIGGATGSSTDLHLRLDGNLVLTGGSAGQNGASLGGSVTGAALANDIVVHAGGDVILDGATGGAGVRIGVSPRVGIAGGDIAIEAANIRILGEAPAAIRTLGNVELHATSIEQGANGLILANALTTSSEGSTLLAGSNEVSSFTGAAGGDLLLRNLSSFLTLGPVGASGALSIDQAGSLLIQATDAPLVVRGGLLNVATGGDFRLLGGEADGAHALLSSGGNIDLTVGGTLRLDEGAGNFSWAKVQTESRDGLITLSFPNLASGGFYVNGVEGDTKDGKSGFFIVHKPAKIGEDLLIDYQE